MRFRLEAKSHSPRVVCREMGHKRHESPRRNHIGRASFVEKWDTNDTNPRGEIAFAARRLSRNGTQTSRIPEAKSRSPRVVCREMGHKRHESPRRHRVRRASFVEKWDTNDTNPRGDIAFAARRLSRNGTQTTRILEATSHSPRVVCREMGHKRHESSRRHHIRRASFVEKWDTNDTNPRGDITFAARRLSRNGTQ